MINELHWFEHKKIAEVRGIAGWRIRFAFGNNNRASHGLGFK
jgi:hypothetical protein